VESAPSGRNHRISNYQFRARSRNEIDHDHPKTFSDSVKCTRNAGNPQRKRDFRRQPVVKSRRRYKGRGAGTKKCSRSKGSFSRARLKNEDIQSVHSTDNKNQTEEESTLLPANDVRSQGGEEWDISKMRKSRGSKVDEKPESKQNDSDVSPLTDSDSCVTKTSSISECPSVNRKNTRTPRASPSNRK